MSRRMSADDYFLRSMRGWIAIGRGNYTTVGGLRRMGLTRKQVKTIKKLGSGYARMEWLKNHSF